MIWQFGTVIYWQDPKTLTSIQKLLSKAIDVVSIGCYSLIHIKIGSKTRVCRFLASKFPVSTQVTGVSLTVLKHWVPGSLSASFHLTEGETSCSTFALIQLADTHVHNMYLLATLSQKARGRQGPGMHNAFAWNYLSVFRVYVCVG